MLLTKDDYGNLLKLLEGVELKGLTMAKYVAVLAHKIETRVAEWVDGEPTGFKTADYSIVQVTPGTNEPKKLLSPPPPVEVPALLDDKVTPIPLNRD